MPFFRFGRFAVGEVVDVKVQDRWQPGVVIAVEKDGRYSVCCGGDPSRVHVGEAASTLSVVCGGSRESKVSAALPFFVSGTGKLTFAGLSAYLTSVFKALFEAKTLKAGASASELGTATARRAFQENGKELHELLEVDAFKRWYSAAQDKTEPPRKTTPPKRSADFSALARRTFGHLAFEDAFRMLSRRARGSKNLISRESFAAALGASPQSEALLALFAAFDVDGDGSIDLHELAAGISMWCRPGVDKIRAAFLLFDADGDGSVDQSEMTRYLTSVFRVALASNADLQNAAAGAEPAALGEATAKQVFEAADTDADGRLSYGEFEKWYASHDTGEKLVSALVSDDAARQVLSGALRGRDPRSVFDAFQRKAGKGGRLTRRAFYSALATSYPSAEAVASKAFDLFDTDADGTVDPKELAAGLAALCGGSRDSKVRFCFDLFDGDADGLLEGHELVACLASVFKLAETPRDPLELADATARAILEAADTDADGKLSYDEFDRWIASSTSDAAQAVATAAAFSKQDPDERTDMLLPRSGGDFKPPEQQHHQKKKTTTARTKQNGAGVLVLDGDDDVEEEEEEESGLWVAASELCRARSLLGLASGVFRVDDLVEIVFDAQTPSVDAPDSSQTSTNGSSRQNLDAATLAKVARRLARLGGTDNNAEAASLFARVFSALEFKPGGVAPADLAAGLVVLAPSSVDDKTRAAIGLFGADSAMTRAGLEAFLLAVYSFLYAASPGLKDVMDVGASPAVLASTTARRCFDDLRLDPDTPSLKPRDFAAFVASGLPH